MNRNETIHILKKLNITPKKNLGQNFLIDEHILHKIISVSEITKNDIILEIGAGLGILTTELSIRAKEVYSYEIDTILFQYLQTKFSNTPNVKLFNENILNATLAPHNKVVSNIPYSITGPILEKVFFTDHPPSGIMIIEKNLAERIFTKNTYKTFSRISVNFNAFMKPSIKESISPHSFYPVPKIELSMIKAFPKEKIDSFLKLKEGRSFFLKFIAGIMPYKNKNLSNAINSYLHTIKSITISKNELIHYLKINNIQDLKLSNYTYDDFIKLSKKIYDLLENNDRGWD